MKKINRDYIKKLLPHRTKLSNKTDAGKVLIIGGGKGLYGAGILSALAATRSGAGYTHLMTDLSKFSWVKFPDFILHPLKLSELKNKNDHVIAIGPGLGTELAKKKFIQYLLRNKFKKVLIDADGLTLLSQMNVKLPSEWLLTPHEGELARLLNLDSRLVKKDRLKYLQEAQRKYGCHILLKGAETLIIDSDQKIILVKEGSPALAKAGTGDVLFGIIAALRAQNLSTIEAATLGAFLHGLASQLWSKKMKDNLSLRPVDLIELLPETIFKLRRTSRSPRPSPFLKH